MANGVITKSRFFPFDQNVGYSNVDLNDFVDTGFYKLSGNITHSAGANNYGFLEVLKFTDSYITQILYAVDDTRLFKRTYNNGTWRNWYAYNGTELT